MKTIHCFAVALVWLAATSAFAAEEAREIAKIPLHVRAEASLSIRTETVARGGRKVHIETLELLADGSVLWSNRTLGLSGAGEKSSFADGAVLDGGLLWAGHRVSLLGIDLATGAIRERRRLSGWAKRVEPHPNGGVRVWTDCMNFGIINKGEGSPLCENRFADGAFTAPVYFGGNLLARMNEMHRPSQHLYPVFADFGTRKCPDAKASFLATHAVFHQDPDAADCATPDISLENVENVYREAAGMDFTNPWHAYHMGQALWFMERRDEAESAWSGMLSGHDGTPYYNFAWMAAYFERLGQRGWADRAWEKTEAQFRRQVPYPVHASTLIEVLINLPTERYAAWQLRADGNVERARLWTERRRALAGATEAESLIAPLWARFYATGGDENAAAAERAFAAQARKNPFDWTHFTITADILLLLASCFTLATIFVAACLIERARKRRPAWRWLPFRAVPWRERAVFGIFLAAAVSCGAWLITHVTFIGALAGTPIGMMDSMGHPTSVKFFEEHAEANLRSARAFFAGYARHLAGDFDKAASWYEKAGAHSKAEENFASARRRNMPSAHPGNVDLISVFKNSCGKNYLAFFDEESIGDTAIIRILGMLQAFIDISLALLAILLLVIWPSEEAKRVPEDEGDTKPWKRRIAEMFVPGLAHANGGKLFLAGTVLACAAFTAGGAWMLNMGPPPAVGIISSIAMPNTLDAFPLPPDAAQILASNRTTMEAFFAGETAAFPLPHVFLIAWLAAAVFALAFHGVTIYRAARGK